jgi:RNA recognition motif-containing protein
MVRTKVFVGNLAFKTVESELAHQFAAAGPVTSANIITRGPRSLGYGFVEFENEKDAENAVKLMNKKEIDGRPINVEIAKPREEGEESKQGPPVSRGRGRGRGFRGGRGRGFRGGFRGAFRGGRGGAGGGGGGVEGPEGGASPSKKPFYKSEVKEDEEDDRPRGRGGFRRRRGGRGGPRGRGGFKRESVENREESKTTLFVANLPFKFDDEAFGKVFSELSLKFKSAHVVKKRNGLSKGYGFAEFDNEADQQKALKEVNGKIVDGRDLSVKVALTDNREDNGKAEEAEPSNQPSGSKAEQKEPAPKKTETPTTEKKQDSVKKETPKTYSPKV